MIFWLYNCKFGLKLVNLVRLRKTRKFTAIKYEIYSRKLTYFIAIKFDTLVKIFNLLSLITPLVLKSKMFHYAE